MGTPTKPHSWCVAPVKFCHDRLSSLQVIRIWIFSRSVLKVLFAHHNFSFWGILPPKFRDTSLKPPKGTSLRGTTHFEPSLVQVGRTVRPVALAKNPPKKKEKIQWQTGYSPRPLTSPYRSQSLHAGWSPVCSSICKKNCCFITMCKAHSKVTHIK